jgi:hypothetical protein
MAIASVRLYSLAMLTPALRLASDLVFGWFAFLLSFVGIGLFIEWRWDPFFLGQQIDRHNSLKMHDRYGRSIKAGTRCAIARYGPRKKRPYALRACRFACRRVDVATVR